jgi:hypothetical protein
LLTPPPEEWLAASAPSHADLDEPAVKVTHGLAFCFELISTMAERGLSEATQAELLRGFYAELRAENALGLLFPASTMTLGERLARRESIIELSSPDPADLTLRALALLGDADYLVYDSGVPAAIRDYARRDATTLHATELDTAPADAGHIVHVRLPPQAQKPSGETS